MNVTVRHHVVHMPDPVVRPGGWPFASWFGATVPQASDRHLFEPSELELTVVGPPLRSPWDSPSNCPGR